MREQKKNTSETAFNRKYTNKEWVIGLDGRNSTNTLMFDSLIRNADITGGLFTGCSFTHVHVDFDVYVINS